MVSPDYLFAMLLVGALYLLFHVIYGGDKPHWRH
jgi:hypothetical protein